MPEETAPTIVPLEVYDNAEGLEVTTPTGDRQIIAHWHWTGEARGEGEMHDRFRVFNVDGTPHFICILCALNNARKPTPPPDKKRGLKPNA